MEFDLGLKKLISKIKKEKAKTVILQFPDGLKKEAINVARHIENSTNARVFIWFGSCYGACDTPPIPANIRKLLNIDLLVQFGHTAWHSKQ